MNTVGLLNEHANAEVVNRPMYEDGDVKIVSYDLFLKIREAFKDVKHERTLESMAMAGAL